MNDTAAEPEGIDALPDHEGTEAPQEESRKLTRTQIFTMISSASMNFGCMICYSILGPFFPQEAVKKEVNVTTVGFIFGCFAIFNFVSSLVLGKYLVQIGAKFMFVSGMLASGVATVLFGLLDKAEDGTWFIVLCFIIRAVDAIGFGAAMTASCSILAKSFPNNIATVMGTLEIFTGLGLVLGPPIGGFLYQYYGYEVPFIAIGAIMLLMVPLNMYILPGYDSVPGKDSFWRLCTLPKVAFMCLILISMSCCMSFLDPTLSLFVTETFHLQVGYVAFVFLGLALSYSLSSPALGLISDKKPELRKLFLIIGCFGTAACFAMLGPAPFFHIKSELWLFILTLVIMGIFLSMSAIPLFPEILSCAHENGFEEGLSTLGLVSGLFSAMWSVGGFLGPTLGGFLNDKFHFEWAAAIQGAISLAVGLAVAIFYIHEHLVKRRLSLRNVDATDEERSRLLINET
ncbi:MFS-type transporter SLC18B1 isoform X1 [Ambystoma mexicanum]|uniref:MFS-type transporter SLC18B1 isoform X1 n=1 Tax=Ambystoma mexicanum TaxID=8296 RepID=UPI0037E911F3